MGYLDLANDMVNNATKTLGDVLNSKFTTHLQGNGTPVLGTYYNIDETLSTTELGTYTIDQVLGGNSPLRYNKINNFPVVGLAELLPSIDTVEGNLLDLSLDVEVTLFPNTIKPTPYDIYVYEYMDGKTVTFKVNSFEFTSIKSNNYYKVQMSLKDINDPSTIDKVEKQTVKCFETKLDTVGTQDKCIIEDKIYEEIEDIEKLISYITEEYCSMFYDKRYNCLLLRDTVFGYPMYDPFLTTFVANNDILDNDVNYKVISNFDYRHNVDRLYRNTLFRHLELRNTVHLEPYCMLPASFSTTDTTPFSYYGEEVVFTLDLIKHDIARGALISKPTLENNPVTYYDYGSKPLIDSIIYYDFPATPTTSRPSKEVLVDNIDKPITKKRVLDHDLVSREGLDKLDTLERPDNMSKIMNNTPTPPPISINLATQATHDELLDIYEEIAEDPLDNIVDPKVEELLPDTDSEEDFSDIYEDDLSDTEDDLSYLDKPIEDEVIDEGRPFILTPFYLNNIRDYLVKDTLYKLFSDEDLKALMEMDIEYNQIDFMHIPMLLYVLRKYVDFLAYNK